MMSRTLFCLLALLALSASLVRADSSDSSSTFSNIYSSFNKLVDTFTPNKVASVAGCQYDGFDFSPLASSDLAPVGSGYTYALRVCGVVSSVEGCYTVSSSASACQDNTVAGEWNGNPEWYYVNGVDATEGVGYSITGTKSCWAQGPTDDYQAKVIFVCDPSATTPPSPKVSIPSTAPEWCVQTYTVNTSLACPGSSVGPNNNGGGLSGGWIFIIILLCSLFVYIVAGCVIKAKKFGAQGMERCPNIDFWRLLPVLVKEGCVFTWGKIMSLIGKGSSSAENYQTM
jgi:hypothetical protein